MPLRLDLASLCQPGTQPLSLDDLKNLYEVQYIGDFGQEKTDDSVPVHFKGLFRFKNTEIKENGDLRWITTSLGRYCFDSRVFEEINQM
jgi:hypothetical protein